MSEIEEKDETKVDQGEEASTAPALRLEDLKVAIEGMAQNFGSEFRAMRTKFDNLSEEVATIQNEQRMVANEMDGLRDEASRLSGGLNRTSRLGGGPNFPTGTPMFAEGYRRQSSIFGPLGDGTTLFGNNPARNPESAKKKESPEEEVKEYGVKAFFKKQEANPRLAGQPNIAVTIPLQKISLKIESLTVNSLIKAKETMREDSADSASPGFRGFHEYFSHNVKVMIVNSETAAKTDLGAIVTLDNFKTFSDELILKMAARYIRRITGKGTIPGFKKIFISSIGSVKIINTERGSWEPQTKGWNQHVHQPLVDWILRFRDVYFILTFGVVRGELIPEENYKKEQPVGLIRIAVEILEDLKHVVIQFITEERLKKMNSMEEFITALEDMNEHFHNSDFELTKRDSRITKEKDYKEEVRDLLQESNTKRIQYDKRRAELGIGQTSGFPRRDDNSTRSFNAPRRANLNRFDVEDSDEDEAKIAPLDEEDSGDDEVVMKGSKHLLQQPVDDIVDDKEEMFDERYSQTMMRMELTEKGSIKSTDQKIRSKNEMPCFVFVDKGVCEDKERCEYSHDMNLCREYAKKALQKSSKSPLLSKEDIASVIGNAKSYGSASGSDLLRKHTSFQSKGPSGIPRIASRSSYPPTSRLKEMTSQSLADEIGMADGQAPN